MAIIISVLTTDRAPCISSKFCRQRFLKSKTIINHSIVIKTIKLEEKLSSHEYSIYANKPYFRWQTKSPQNICFIDFIVRRLLERYKTFLWSIGMSN